MKVDLEKVVEMAVEAGLRNFNSQNPHMKLAEEQGHRIHNCIMDEIHAWFDFTHNK